MPIKLILRVGRKFKYESVLEHVIYNFDITDVSKALLQEHARLRMANLSVKSTRYTLTELKKEDKFDLEDISKTDDTLKRAEKYLVYTGNTIVDHFSIMATKEESLKALQIYL